MIDGDKSQNNRSIRVHTYIFTYYAAELNGVPLEQSKVVYE